jgi:predicted DNA repair protein MutK
MGLLDDIAALAKLAAASIDDVGAATGRATAKAAGVVVDDTAVTPQYLRSVAAKRELPIVWKIAVGSIRNKLVFILPAALLLSQFLPWLLPIVLMIGGTYLAYEGAEKIWHKVSGHHDAEVPATEVSPEAEKKMIAGAIRTDLILSAEIMVIALDEVADEAFWSRLAILVVVAFVITIIVYGIVAAIVKMDDVGLRLAQFDSGFSRTLGRGLVKAMPRVLAVISVVGTIAMLWVGGHILLVNLGADGTGWIPAPYEWVHHLEVEIHDGTGALGGTLGWLFNTLCSAIVGLIVGAVVVAVLHLLPSRKKDSGKQEEQVSH